MGFFEFPHTRTYDSDLGWLIKEMSAIDDAYEELVSWMNTHKTEYEALSRRVTLLENEIDSFEAEIDRRFNQLSNELHEDIYTQIQTALSFINPALADLQSQITELHSALSSLQIYLDARIEAEDEILKTYVDQKITDLINEIPDLTTVNVFNPVRGEITSIQIAIDDLYSLGRSDALTAYEYDILGISAEDYDDLELTAIQYDQFGRLYLERAGLIINPYHYMVSPFTGELVLLETVINELASLHKDDTLTAMEYDALDLTASYYDALDLSAYDYDWHGKTLVA